MWAQIEDECGIARARAWGWLGMKPIGGLVRYGEPSGDHAAADSADVRGHRLRLTATQAPTKGAKAADLIAEDYGLFFGSAGHAALYDYPTVRRLRAVAENVWERGGIVAAVCHGPVPSPGVVDSGTGKSIIEGKTVTVLRSRARSYWKSGKSSHPMGGPGRGSGHENRRRLQLTHASVRRLLHHCWAG
jgi:hypothetical protein